MRSAKVAILSVGTILIQLSVGRVQATPPTFSAPSGNESTNSMAQTGFFTGMARSDYMLGDMGGLRPWLSKYGVSLNILETSEVLGNVSGGINQGFEYDGLTQMILQWDTQRALNWYGGTFNVSGCKYTAAT